MGKHEVKLLRQRQRPHLRRPAIFLDRDGTIIRHVDDVFRSSQLKILKSAPEALSIFRGLGFYLLVITNQPVISKGMIDRKGVDRLHGILNARLKARSATLDAFYVCPHRHWDYCPCRKPQVGSVKQAIKEYHIDVRNSFFIGDSMRDVATGKNAKMKTILVMTGKKGSDRESFKVRPDFVARDILAAAKLVRRAVLSL